MAGKRTSNTAKIRAYILTRMKLGLCARDIYIEICGAYGCNEVSYRTVARWISKFKCGMESVKDAPKSGRKKTAITPKNIQKVKDLIARDARYTVGNIARFVGISVGSVHTILKKILKVRRLTARWIPHLLTDEQKRQRVKTARELLERYPKFDKNVFNSFVTGDETWVHFFEPQRKVNNKIWATKNAKRPCVAKRLQSSKKVMFAIFFGTKGPVTQVAVPKGRSVNAFFYKNRVLKKVKKYFEKRRPKTGFKGVHLQHDNAPCHKAKLVTDFLSQEKVKTVPHPPYSPDLAPCDFFLFPRLKKYLTGRRYGSRAALGSGVYQCLMGIPIKDYERAFQQWIKRLKLCISHGGEYFEGLK